MRAAVRRPGSAVCARGALRAAGMVVATLAASACSTVQVRYPDGRTEYVSREAFAEYVEQVFRYQNRVVNELIFATSLSGDADEFSDAALVRAERDMAAACRPLTDTVAAELEGRAVGLFQKLALADAVPACEAASRRLEALLPPI